MAAVSVPCNMTFDEIMRWGTHRALARYNASLERAKQLRRMGRDGDAVEIQAMIDFRPFLILQVNNCRPTIAAQDLGLSDIVAQAHTHLSMVLAQWDVRIAAYHVRQHNAYHDDGFW